MSEAERRAWDERYASGAYTPREQPSAFVEHWLGRLGLPRAQGAGAGRPARALDIACGAGRNALRLAEAGFVVDAVDISPIAIERCRAEAERRGLPVRAHVLDLDDEALPGTDYDLVTVIRYRNLALWPRLRAALAPDGWILVDHHLRTTRDVGGPADEAFRLEPGELLRAFADLRIVHHDEAIEDADLGEHPHFVVNRFAACNGDPGW